MHQIPGFRHAGILVFVNILFRPSFIEACVEARRQRVSGRECQKSGSLTLVQTSFTFDAVCDHRDDDGDDDDDSAGAG